VRDVVLLEPVHPEAEAVLEGAGCRLRRGSGAELAGAAAILTRGRGRLPAEALRAAGPSLACVGRVGAGTELIDVQAATALGVPVFYAPDAFTATTAEHALALLLAVARRIPAMDRAVRAGGWEVREQAAGLELAGRRLGVVGLGRTGRCFAALARALGMEVVAWSRRSADPRFPLLSLEELLRTSDVVSLHLALEPSTVGFLGPERIAAMRRGAILLNVARGALVDEAALVRALREGRLAGAGLDVLVEEPPPPEHPLLALPQVVLTPHSAAMTTRAFREACLQVAGAVAAYLAGQPPDPALLRNPAVLLRREGAGVPR
jgi:D-3-phosphoglycerate dehydrogenase